ncbi:MAG: T9SS type A sorting domain-containing protein [Flavobacteriales bacterium]|nr:T9SS type A sorting domain-containing protein [Flavobacteriales bacterium]
MIVWIKRSAHFRSSVLFLFYFVGPGVEAQSYQVAYPIHNGTSVPALGVKLGWSMAVSNDRVAIGSPHFDAQYGRVSLHALDGSDEPQLLSYCRDNLINGAGDNPIQQRFGAMVAMDGEWLVVGNCSPFGASEYSNEQAARVLIYLYTDDTLQAYQSIPAPAASGGAFGKAIAIDQNLIAVGGARSFVAGTWRDVVYLYRKSGALWPVQPTDSVVSNGTTDLGYGYSLALRNGSLLVGDSGDDELGVDCGAAFLYGQDQGGTGNWGLVRKLLPSNGLAGDHFGTAVALTNDRCVVGAPKNEIDSLATGAAYVYERDQGFPGNWGESATLEPIGVSAAYMDYGAAVAIGTDRIAVGAPDHDLGSNGSDGSVHVYQKVDNGWPPLQRIVPYEDGIIGQVGRAGTSLAFHGDQLLIGVPWGTIQGLDPPPPPNMTTGGVLVYEEGPVSIPELGREMFKLWPNPVSNVVHLSDPNGAMAFALVLDTQGRLAMELGKVQREVNTWDLSILRPGAYLLEVRMRNGERITRRLIKDQ